MEIYGKKLNLVSVEFEQKFNRKRLESLEIEMEKASLKKGEVLDELVNLISELPPKSREEARRRISMLTELEGQSVSFLSRLEEEYIFQGLSDLESLKNELALKSIAGGNGFLSGSRFRL